MKIEAKTIICQTFNNPENLMTKIECVISHNRTKLFPQILSSAQFLKKYDGKEDWWAG